VDGVMIGRAAIGSPWIFKEIKHFIKTGEKIEEPGMQERVDAVRKHVQWSCKWKGEITGILEMRRHYANYFKGIENFKPFRKQLVSLMNKDEIYDTLDQILVEYPN
ncbi:MAG: tRNA-dihydrouridine synthase, partial [Weeksellaceae bacterium]